jgi:predicted ATPase
MIHSIEVVDPKNTPVKWWDQVNAIKNPGFKIEFKRGLNVLWGPNGCGKSTVLKALARLFHCEQSGFPVITNESIREVSGGYKEPLKLTGLTVKHDGQGVRFFDPSHAVGLMGGMAAFDWDFGMEGIANAVFKGSAGQTNLFRFSKILTSLKEHKTPKIEMKVHKDDKRLEPVWAFLQGDSEGGPPTVLFDEPERSFDIPNQASLWEIMYAISLHAQVIVASHCPFGANIPIANYIDMKPGYLDECRKVIDKSIHPGKTPTTPIEAPEPPNLGRPRRPGEGRL